MTHDKELSSEGGETDVLVEARELLSAVKAAYDPAFYSRAPELITRLCDELEAARETIERLSTCDCCEKNAVARACRTHGGRP